MSPRISTYALTIFHAYPSSLHSLHYITLSLIHTPFTPDYAPGSAGSKCGVPIPSTIAFCSNDLSTRTVSAALFSTGFDRTSPDVLSASATTVLRRKPLSFSTEFRRDPSLAQCYSCSIPRISFVSPPSMVSVHTRTPMIFKYMIMRCKRLVQVW